MKLFLLPLSLTLCVLASHATTLDGKLLFQENCASCHGVTGKGGTREVKGPVLVGDASKWSLKLFERAVLKGIDDSGKPLESAMPHWKDASFKSDNGHTPSKEEVAAIHRYLRSGK